MQIQRIPFPPIGSNMYIVTQGRDAIVLDPWPDAETMARLQEIGRASCRERV